MTDSNHYDYVESYHVIQTITRRLNKAHPSYFFVLFFTNFLTTPIHVCIFTYQPMTTSILILPITGKLS
jgi:hypothetical protein